MDAPQGATLYVNNEERLIIQGESITELSLTGYVCDTHKSINVSRTSVSHLRIHKMLPAVIELLIPPGCDVDMAFFPNLKVFNGMPIKG